MGGGSRATLAVTTLAAQQNRKSVRKPLKNGECVEEMNWEAIGAIGELLGAIAVVISLVYVASQVKSGTRALKTTTRDSAFHSLQEWNYSVLSEPDLAWIFQRGMAEPHVLDERQQARFVHLMYGFLKLYENIYLHVLDGSVGAEAWEHNKEVLAAFANQPGTQRYWNGRRPIFDPRFADWFDSLEAPDGVMVIDQLAKSLSGRPPEGAPDGNGAS